MTSRPKTKPFEQDAVNAETPEDPENRELSMEELAIVTGGDDDDTAWFSSPGPWDPP